RDVTEAGVLIGCNNRIVLLVEDAGQDQRAVGRKVRGHLWREFHQRAGKDVGDDQLKWSVLDEDWIVKTRRCGGGDVLGDVVERDIVGGDVGCDGVDVGGQDWDRGKLGKGNGQNGAAGAKV